MKECQAQGLIGQICRKHDECFMRFYAESESEKNTLPSVRRELDRIEGCKCQSELTDIVEKRMQSDH
jgi:hypothetical protein